VGATVVAYWPGMTDAQIDAQPGFYNDCNAWGDWMAERERHPDVLQTLEALGLGALRTFTTDGVADDDVDWVTPAGLCDAASRLRALVLVQDPRVTPILRTYARSAHQLDQVPTQLAQDLADVCELARFAEREGATRMTLAVNW
jgi:hypothetical protein